MRWSFVVLAAVLMCASVEAQGHDQTVSLDLHQTVTADMLSFEACQAAVFLPLENGFRFEESVSGTKLVGGATQGCGNATLQLEHPGVVDHLHVRFLMDRSVDRASDTFAPSFAQRLIIHQGGAPLEQRHVVAPTAAATTNLFIETDSLATPGGADALTWNFQDVGEAGVSNGHAYAANVREPSVEYSGLPADTTIHDSLKRSGDLQVREVRVEVDVPGELTDAYKVDIRIRLDRDLRPDHVVAPDGTILTETGTRNAPGVRGYNTEILLYEHLSSSDKSQLVIPHGLTAVHGNGTYVAVFTALAPANPTLASVGAVSAGLAMPAVAATVSVLGALGFRRKAAMQQASGNSLLALLAAMLGAYAALVGYTLTGDRLAVAAHDPLGSTGLPIIGGILGLSIGFLGVAWFRARILERSLQVDIQRKAQVQRELERSNASLQDFASAVAHDLKAPLRTMSLYTGLMKRNTKDPQILDTADKVQGGAQKMGELIDGLLIFARAGTSGHARTIDTDEMVGQILEALTADAASASIDVGKLPPIHGDPAAIWQVMSNLILNALKHAGADPRIAVTGGATATETWILVEDNGPGVEPVDRERIFQPFARGATGAEGTGLGLATVQRIVKGHGGTIRVEASRLGGAAFRVTLPRPL